MKVFAILTASLMAAGGAAYYLQDSCSSCQHTKNCPVANTGGCCTSDAESPSCCSFPCSDCATSCPDCCELCRLCCTAGVQAPVSAKVATGPDCCAVGDVCCLASAACCTGAEAASKPVVRANGCDACVDGCELCDSPAKLGAAAVIAGASLK